MGRTLRRGRAGPRRRASGPRTGDAAIAPQRILVIKHGALGDIVLATGPFRAIREAHARDRLTLLTASAYVDFLGPSGWFDEIEVDDRPPAWRVGAWFGLVRGLRARRYHRVYDLQTSGRTNLLYRALSWRREIEWSGIAPGCSHPHRNPRRGAMHTVERQAEQLAAAGIARTPAADLGWVRADVARFRVPGPYALLVPGGARHRPAKRWPAAKYAELARALAGDGATPVLIGTAAEAAALHDIAARAPRARDLCGRTALADIVALARGAAVTVGNDTGPVHLAAAAGCPSVVLYSSESDPDLAAPRGAHVKTLRAPELAELDVDTVAVAARRAQAAGAGVRRRA